MIQVHLQAVPLLVTQVPALPAHQVLEAVQVEDPLAVDLQVEVLLAEALMAVHLVVDLLEAVLEAVLLMVVLLEAVLEELKSKLIDGAIIIFLEI